MLILLWFLIKFKVQIPMVAIKVVHVHIIVVPCRTRGADINSRDIKVL